MITKSRSSEPRPFPTEWNGIVIDSAGNFHGRTRSNQSYVTLLIKNIINYFKNRTSQIYLGRMQTSSIVKVFS